MRPEIRLPHADAEEGGTGGSGGHLLRGQEQLQGVHRVLAVSNK